MAKKEKELTFEQALSDLDTLVKQLEQGEAPLAELVQSYEKGQALLRICRDRLQDAELRVKVIIENGIVSAEESANEN